MNACGDSRLRGLRSRKPIGFRQWVVHDGEIDIMGDISYTGERAQKMLFSDDPMGEEKYILYADLSNMDIGTSDFKFMDGKRVGVLMDTEPEIMLTEWENKNGIHTEHVNVNNDSAIFSMDEETG